CPRRHLTIDQQHLTIARLQTGCSQTEVATELRVSQSVISRMQKRYRETGRVTERHRSGRPLATSHTDDRFIVNSALRNRMMNATQIQACLREVRGTQVSRQTIRNHLHQHVLRARRPARVPDHTTRHRCHCLAWARQHLRWTRDQWASVLFSDESRFMLSRNDANNVGDIKESTMHQPLLSPDEPLVVVLLLCGQMCLVSTELLYTL
uniref:Transposase Tc1-like domain-containing protein n=1 Tax=Myripristis murdjan TaxID=586833 RepID=A0A667XTL2_9TELE